MTPRYTKSHYPNVYSSRQNLLGKSDKSAKLATLTLFVMGMLMISLGVALDQSSESNLDQVVVPATVAPPVEFQGGAG